MLTELERDVDYARWYRGIDLCSGPRELVEFIDSLGHVWYTSQDGSDGQHTLSWGAGLQQNAPQESLNTDS